MNIKTCEADGCVNIFAALPSNKRFCSPICKKMGSAPVSSPTAIKVNEEDIDLPTEVLEKLDFLRKENTRLATLLRKHRNISAEISMSVLDTVRELVPQIRVDAPRRARAPKGGTTLVANPWNSDTQLGKVTPSYNSAIAAERVEIYTDKIIDYTNEFRQSYNITKCNVYFLGDIVEGESIFPSQPHVIDSSLYEQVAKNGPAIYGSQIRRLLEVFDEVHVVAIIGNHGGIGRFFNPETNMDRVLYKILEHMFAYEPRVTFNIPDGRGESMFYAVDSIGRYSTLLIHGDQLSAPSSIGSYSNKILSWKTSGIEERFDDVAMGHWHQNTKATFGKTVVRIAGSVESHNTYAQERLGVMGNCSQHMQMVDPTKGVVWESDIYLEEFR